MAAWSAARCSDLPKGGCYFSDPTQGHGAPSCPCQHFYLDHSRQDPRYGYDQSFYCFCGHHACFHSVGHAVDAPRLTQPIVPENVSTRTSHADLTTERRPVAPMGIWEAFDWSRQNASNHVPGSSALPSTDSQTSQPARPSPAPLAYLQRHEKLSNARVRSRHGAQESSISASEVNVSTIRENRLNAAHQMADSSALPTTASQPRQPAHLPASSFAQRHEQLPIARYQSFLGNQDSPMSPTEINTPSLRGSPLFVQPFPHAIPSKENVATEPQRKDAGTQCEQEQLDPSSKTQKAAALRDLVARVDRLESLSYSHVPLEEVEDKFENHDYRINNLEEFRSDMEPRLVSHEHESTSSAANTSASSVSSSCQSPVGGSSPALSATAAVYAEYSHRFQDLESQIEALIESVPSVQDPWHVEVVLLPWGRHLPGIWKIERKSDQTQQQHSRDEWNEFTFAAQPALGESFSSRSTSSDDLIRAWRDVTSDWLNPKAHSLQSLVRKRLWSRGLIQTIEVTSNDAFAFMQRCKAAFDRVIRPRQAKESIIPLRLRKRYDALEEPLVPLRKIRKISRLSFLAPSEMVTAAAWTPTSLDSSVFMKSHGSRRLFVTFPESYIQPVDDDGWTWQTIRGLRPIRQPSPRAGPGFDGFDKSSDLKTCWNHNETLDAPPPVVTTFVSEATTTVCRSVSSPNSRATDDNGMLLNVPTPLMSPISETRTARINRRRTTSLSSLHQSESSAPGVSTKRRFLSTPEDIAPKRRRPSTASDRNEPGSTAITPRLSRERSLPVTSDVPLDIVSDDRSSARRASNTPIAYPTPHSNYIHTVSTVRLTDRDGDTEADTEIGEGRSSPFRTEEEWQGMGDDEGQPSSSVRIWDEEESRVD